LSEGSEWFSRRYREGLISGISAGFFLLLIGAIFVITPNLLDRIISFFRNFGLMFVPNFGSLRLPAPANPLIHSVLYGAVELFCYVWGLFQIGVLVLRFLVRSSWSKKAETVSNIVFWLGTGFLIRTFLIETTLLPLLAVVSRWFVFWSGIIMLIGAILIIRAIILAVASSRYIT